MPFSRHSERSEESLSAFASLLASVAPASCRHLLLCLCSGDVYAGAAGFVSRTPTNPARRSRVRLIKGGPWRHAFCVPMRCTERRAVCVPAFPAGAEAVSRGADPSHHLGLVRRPRLHALRTAEGKPRQKQTSLEIRVRDHARFLGTYPKKNPRVLSPGWSSGRERRSFRYPLGGYHASIMPMVCGTHSITA